MSDVSYQVVLQQNMTGVTVVSDPFHSLDGAYGWLKAYGVFDPKGHLIGHVHSPGSAVVGRWEIRRVIGG